MIFGFINKIFIHILFSKKKAFSKNCKYSQSFISIYYPKIKIQNHIPLQGEKKSQSYLYRIFIINIHGMKG